MNTWQLQEAKSKFSQVVDKAIRQEPQIVTRHGIDSVVVISYREFQRLTKPKTDLVDFLWQFPACWGGK